MPDKQESFEACTEFLSDIESVQTELQTLIDNKDVHFSHRKDIEAAMDHLQQAVDILNGLEGD